jgi:anti-sigma factor RsiW
LKSLTDQDLDLLDAHLDDALSPIEAEHLRLRLAAEAELAAGLEQLRAERAARQAAWQAMDAAESAAATLATDTLVRAKSHERWSRIARAAGALAAAAACFMAGWVGRTAATVEAQDVPRRPAVSAKSQPARPTDRGPGTYQVALTDSSGNVLAVQKFTRLDEAQRFAADLTLWQAQQQQIQEGQLMLVADEF